MARRRRSTAQKARNKVLEIVVSLLFLWLMITVVLPWAANNFANNARDRFIPTPAASP